MISVDEARHRILATARLADIETLPLAQCAGRVPVEFSLTAAVNVPPFANSAMDGFALRSGDTPGVLHLVGEVVAGAGALPSVASGQSVRIMTGAPMPPGADSVVPLEEAEEKAGGQVRVDTVSAGQHVRVAGSDTQAGDQVELPRAPIGAGTLGLLASLGLGELAVRSRPLVAILSTGDELVAPGAALLAGQIHDANSAALAAAALEAGAHPHLTARAPDDLDAIEALLATAAADADLVLVSGGVSMGRTDHVRAAIERLGAIDFWKIAVQPGKPLAFGKIAGRPVFGLPGNPVSALVTFELFVRPLLRSMLGLAGDGRVHLRARLLEPIGKDPQRRTYVRVVLTLAGDGLVARSTGGQGSARLRGLAAANGLLVLPEGLDAGAVGETYDAILLGEVA